MRATDSVIASEISKQVIVMNNILNKCLVPLALLSCASLNQAFSAETFVSESTVITACGKLFAIDANAAGLTAEQRARIIQRNLDNALISAKHRTPSAVRVVMMNRNPVVALDGYYIATADGNSAARNGMTQLELAEKWAESIRMCLSDTASIDKYLAMLTGSYKMEKGTAFTR